MDKTLKYGDPDESDIRTMSKPHPLIPIDPLSLTIVPIPPNSKEELLKVIAASSNPSLPLQVRRICDMDISEPFRIILEERGIKFPEDSIDEIRKNLRPIVKKLKYYFNRPRPAQVAEDLDIIFVYDDLASAESPSYPSGHTLSSYVLAGSLARLFPELMEEIYTAAEMIALSRIEAGVHFPSDNLYGMLLAEEILNVMF